MVFLNIPQSLESSVKANLSDIEQKKFFANQATRAYKIVKEKSALRRRNAKSRATV